MDKWKHLVSKKIMFDGIHMEYGWGTGLKVDKLMETSKWADYREENFLLEVLFVAIMACHIHKDYIDKTNADPHRNRINQIK